MESNGAPNRIHMSEATATLIKAAGKGTWITMREDRIMAKGKGEMQTYWCEPKAAGSVTSSYTLSTSVHTSARSWSPPTTPTGETNTKSIESIQQMLDANDPTLGSSSVSDASLPPCLSPCLKDRLRPAPSRMNQDGTVTLVEQASPPPPAVLPSSNHPPSPDGDGESLPSTTETSSESGSKE